MYEEQGETNWKLMNDELRNCEIMFCFNVFSGILKIVSKLYVQHPPCGSNVNQKSKTETQKVILPCTALIVCTQSSVEVPCFQSLACVQALSTCRLR